jgi:hypothetical protein
MVQAEGVSSSACSPRRRIGADDHWHLGSMPRAGPGHPLVHRTGADNDPTPTEPGHLDDVVPISAKSSNHDATALGHL